MVRSSSRASQPKYYQATSAKELLDQIGQSVHAEVQRDAKKYVSELKGNLSRATYPKDESPKGTTSPDPCHLDYRYHTNVTKGHGKEYPCEDRPEVRFSDTEGAQCDKSKIKDNKGKSEGACAPYRRSSLCDHHLSYMNAGKTNTTDNLLLEVCMSAQYEGQSIRGQHDKHKLDNNNSSSQLCTVLARSFADIGDIIRGRDLYRRDKGEETKLEKNLKEIFKNIYNELTTKNGTKERYNDTDNYFQLREDWWEENRETVWKAITCHVVSGNNYFRHTCSDENHPTATQGNCRCIGATVPTYFDYVPQYLRWFEEWAEDFCRKKKKYVDIVKTYCREKDKDGNQRYCSRNGYDCTKTKPAIGKYRMGNQCTKCLFACNPYVEWIDNQRKQFLKQKQRYENVIKRKSSSDSGGGRKKRAARSSGNSSNYDGYESKFYKELQNNGYQTVDAFLGLLSKEKACTAVNDDKGGRISFENVNSRGGDGGAASGDRGKGASGDGTSGTNDINNGTFYRSDYCQPCPYCGMKRKSDGKWEPKREDEKCTRGKLYEPKKDAEATNITILKSGEGKEEIEKKLNAFCKTQIGNGSGNASSGVGGSNSEMKELIEKWQCYKHDYVKEVGEKDEDDDDDGNYVEKGGGLCILEKTKGEENVNKQKTFHDFFYYWVAHMLKDSIHWRTKRLKSCISNGTTMKCKNGCNTKCKCYESWVQQKKNEWDPIKQQFRKQNMGENTLYGNFGHNYVLDGVLKEEFYKEKSEDDSTQDKQNSLDSEEAEELKQLSKIIEREENQDAAVAAGSVPGTEQKNIMDKLIEHEGEEAETCKKIQKDCENQKQQPKPSPARSEDHHDPQSPSGTPDNRDSSSEDSEDDSDNEDEGEVEEDHVPDDVEVEAEEAEEELLPEEEGEEGTTQDGVKPPCDIVDKLFQNPEQFKDACTFKYVTGKNYGWKCVPTTSGDKGSICVPPRRRKLYIGRLTQWANNSGSNTGATGNTQESGSETPSQPSSAPSTSESSDKDPKVELLKAFVESAAVETFFLWDRYKKQKEKPQGGAGSQLQLDENITSTEDGEDPNPQEQLKSGKIPDDFKRQMFYTLADYKDILFSGSNDTTSGSKDTSSSSNDNLKHIVLEASGDKQDEMKKIQDKIKEHINSGSKPSGQTPQQWWEKHGKDIWEGMICALTYDTNTTSGENPTQDTQVKEKLWDSGKKQPKDEYQYKTVKLDDTSDPKTVSSTSDTPLLSNFIQRPPYFRYLEEWGETFCRQRTRMLKDVKTNCLDDRDGKKCSCYGEHCEDQLKGNPSTVSSLLCQDCGKSCGLYKTWIERKKIEFHKQSGAYGEQKKKCQTQRNDGGLNDQGNGDCGTVTTCDTAAAFLDRLKSGPCKKDSGEGNGKDKLNFNEPDKTFKEAENCKPCSEFKINCNGNGHCKGDEGNTCQTKNSISAENIEKMGQPTDDISMLVSDNSTKEFKGGLGDCKNSGIFTGIIEKKWKCGKVCGYVVCKPEKGNGKTTSGKNNDQIITIRGLVEHWVENFLDDYNKIRKKLKACMKNGKGSICKKDCVENWIKKKTTEWTNLKSLYLKQYGGDDSDNSFPVRSILEELIPQIPVANAKNKVIKLSVFENSKGCCVKANEQNKNGEYKDAIDCMIKKLEEKVTSCLSSTSGKNQTQAQCDSTPLDDDLLLEEEQNPENMRPGFCPQQETPAETVDEETCDAHPPQVDVKEEEEEPVEPSSGEQSPNLPKTPEEKPSKPPAAEKKTKAKRSPRPIDDLTPALKKAMLSSTIMWSIGIGFAADITSSSESEYEELDINDIYAPGSPKYKTLIEVVLEPSGNNTTASGKNTTASGNNTTASGNNTTASGNNTTASGKNTPSDTQNDIHNDIPSSDTPMNKFTDEEWNQLKHEFISQYLQSEQPNDVPNDYSSGDIPLNTQPNTLYFDKPEEKPFIMSIHDRDLYSGEEYSYNVNMVNNDIPMSGKNGTYSGIDLINDSLSGNHIDIYDEMLKRKENELFGTEHHPKRTTTTHFATPTRDDPIHNQLELFHKWLDRHRDMCEKWKNNHERLPKLKELWENETHSGNTHPSDSNKTLNTDVSIQIHMDNPKPINEFTNMNTILEDLDKPFNEPYYDVQDDIYYDVNT
ncbi:hypothetical protein PFBG_04115 [Plasmodium falciparum 7G8]|uniref:Erythrocyte membrane protein 1, PfEMP1 n=1 Tax=Plasmodium falciparum (isolate 7G8) TaxID=57266 RepID=W7EY11_PLAF8|nr:hypothetical protein PFBG_04115 [Plasmodium falciparum 7G8]